MKNYLNYLKEKPFKIAWLVFIWWFTFMAIGSLISMRDVITEDNSEIVYWLLIVFVSVVFLVANYQPYKEYKDGL